MTSIEEKFELFLNELQVELQRIDTIAEQRNQAESLITKAQQMEKKVVDREIEVRRKRDLFVEEQKAGEELAKEWRLQEQTLQKKIDAFHLKEIEMDKRKQENLKLEAELREKQKQLQSILDKEVKLEELKIFLEQEKLNNRERALRLDQREKSLNAQAEAFQRRLNS